MSERDIFIGALQTDDPGERRAYLEAACGADEALRRRVDGLLEVYARAGSFLEEPAVPPGGTAAYAPSAAVDAAPGPEAGVMIAGRYKLLQQIGEGGMGTVWLAEQTEPVRRKVAVKLIKPGMDSRQVLARFEAERQALALMDHPNIAKVHDAGTTPDGRPYFVMELVKGVPITRYCDDHHLTPRQRLELFVAVCQAVQHAHQKGVIHRDLKPSNVLVAPYDGRPVPKVIDFGVAKAAGQPLTEKTLFTGFGAIVGTLEYMSPEQAELNNQDIDTRSDVYALGVLLYELLTGTTPLTKKRLKEAALLEVLRLVREEEPPRPSTRLSSTAELPSIAASRGLEPRKLSGLVRGELDWIVMRALEKDRARRYETATGFAADVQRYLADEPVQACPPSAGYRLRKFARRNQRALATAVMVAVVLLTAVGAVGGTIGWAARAAASRRADAESRAAEALDEAERRLLTGNPRDPRLVAAAGRAESQQAGGLLHPERSRRVHELLADLKMLERLEEIRFVEADQLARGIGMVGADPAYARAFREYGVDVDALTPREAGERLRSRSIAVHLASGLDSWARARRNRTRKAEDWARLLEVAWTCDPDPWRASFRQALARNVSGEVLQNLAKDATARELPPATFLTLASVIRDQWAVPLVVEVLRHAQRQHPADFWINNELAYILAAQLRPPRPQEAVGYARAAVGIRPASPIAHVVLGISLSSNGELDEAAANYRKVVELDPNARAYALLGSVLSKQNKPDEAAACFRRAIELDPKYPHVHYNLAAVLHGQRKLDEAVATYREAIRHDPNYGPAYYNLGNALDDQGKLDAAIDCYRKAVELDPTDYKALNNWGAALARSGKADEAVAHYTRAIEINPQYARAHSNLGGAHQRLGRPDQAASCYRKAIKLDPKFADAHVGLGNALGTQGKVDEAVAHFRKAIELDPKQAVARSNLGIALLKLGELDEATASHKKAIEIDPNHAPAYVGLGDIHSDLKQYDKAVGYYRKAIELDPKYVAAHNDLAWLLATCPDTQLRDPVGAVEHAQRAVELSPGTGHYWNTLGVAHYRAGGYKAAVAALEKSMELSKGGDGFDWFFLTMAHRQLGNADDARRWYDRAVAWTAKNKPDDEELRRFRAEAAELLGVAGGVEIAPPPREKK